MANNETYKTANSCVWDIIILIIIIVVSFIGVYLRIIISFNTPFWVTYYFTVGTIGKT